MSNERRTELKSNLLADKLEAAFLAVKPHLKTIGVILGLLIIASIALAIGSWRREKLSAEAWTSYYFSANKPEVLRDVTADHPNELAAAWAKQAIGDSLMSDALEKIYLDRDVADKLLDEAAQNYRAALSTSSEPLLVSRATLGLGQVLETQGKASDAVAEYKKIIEMKGVHPELQQDVQRRIDFLQSPDGEKFVTWFRSIRPVDPKPIDVPGNLQDVSPKPDIDFTSPSAPKLDLPSLPAEQTTGNASDTIEPPSNFTAPPLPETAPAETSPVAPPAKPPTLDPPN